MPDLSGTVALVTGSSRGIGAGIAERLASDGAAVAVNYRSSEEAARNLARRIQSEGGRAEALQADVSQAGDVRQLFEETEERFGASPSIVVNNAGVVLDAPLSDTEEADFENVIGANVRGVFLVCREAARRMDAGGRIVNLSSNAVRHPREGQAVYAASKAAIEPMTKVLAKELGEREITVNAVAPGATETDMMPEEAREVAPQMTALGRLGQPEDIAGAVALLCSDDAGWITGQVVGVDGGLMS
jgi:3-oxoacyl-[acyl-carrier protein] reductase